MFREQQELTHVRRGGIGLFGLASAFAISLSATSAHAVVILDETFLGTPDDNNYFIVAEPSLTPRYPIAGNLAVFNFNLDRLANNNNLTRNRARLIDSGTEVANAKPTEDEASFVPDVLNIDSAVMTFHFSSADTDVERIKIRINIPNAANEIVFDQSLDLFADTSPGTSVFKLDLDFAALGLLDELADGRVTSVGLAPGVLLEGDPFAPPRNIANDYQIDQVRLVATAVPEPSSLVLMGIGLAAAGVVRRRKRAA